MFQVHLQMWRNFGTPGQKVTRKGTYHSWSKAEVRWTEVGMLFFFQMSMRMLLHGRFFLIDKKHMPKEYVCKKTYYVLSVCIWCMALLDIPKFMQPRGSGTPIRLNPNQDSKRVDPHEDGERLEPPHGIPEFVALKSSRWNEVNTHDDSFFWTAPHAGFCFFGRNIERFRKIFGQLMIKCPARNRTMVFYFWFIVRRWEGNKILVIVSSKMPYNSLILI